MINQVFLKLRLMQQSPTPIVPLEASASEIKEPQVVLQGENHAIACWTGVNGQIKSGYSSDAGVNWTVTGALSGNGASRPQAAINIIDEACIVYELSGKILGQYSVDGGATWTASVPLNLSDISAEKPKVVINDLGMAVVVWVRNNGMHTIIESVFSSDGGASWSFPQILSNPNEDADNLKVCLNSDGNTIAVWQSYNGVHTTIQYAYSFDGGFSFSSNIELTSSSEDNVTPDVSLNDDGVVAIVYRNSLYHDILVCSSVDEGISFSPSVILSSSLGDAVNPSVIVNGQDYALVLWSIDRSSFYTVETICGNFFNVYLVQDRKTLLFQYDYVNRIFCDPVPEASLYRIYKDVDLTELLYQGNVPEFFEHGQKKGISKTYYVTWADLYGEESSSATISGP